MRMLVSVSCGPTPILQSTYKAWWETVKPTLPLAEKRVLCTISSIEKGSELSAYLRGEGPEPDGEIYGLGFRCEPDQAPTIAEALLDLLRGRSYSLAVRTEAQADAEIEARYARVRSSESEPI